MWSCVQKSVPRATGGASQEHVWKDSTIIPHNSSWGHLPVDDMIRVWKEDSCSVQESLLIREIWSRKEVFDSWTARVRFLPLMCPVLAYHYIITINLHSQKFTLRKSFPRKKFPSLIHGRCFRPRCTGRPKFAGDISDNAFCVFILFEGWQAEVKSS